MEIVKVANDLGLIHRKMSANQGKKYGLQRSRPPATSLETAGPKTPENLDNTWELRSASLPLCPPSGVLKNCPPSQSDGTRFVSGVKGKRKRRKANRPRDLCILTANMAADSSTAAPSPTTPYLSRTPAPQAPPPPSLAQLTPHLFDIIPSTERLLSRLLLPEPGIEADGSSGSANQDLLEHKQHLDIQKLESSANHVRVQIQKARQGVAGLPDIDRTIDEQKEEIDWLEDRIARMQEMMDKVRHDFAKDRELSLTRESADARP